MISTTISLFREQAASAAGDLLQKVEQEVQAALDAYAPGWTLDDVRWRCSLVSAGFGTVQTLKFDEQPLLEIHPVEKEVIHDTTTIVIRYTQKVKRLYAREV